MVRSKRERTSALRILNDDVVQCRRCTRLRRYTAQVAQDKRKAYAEWTYWGRPVPSFGDPMARILIVGLAPGAHGANRTGRMFTGDRSGDFLYAALHRAGLANQPTSVQRDDGLSLRDVLITAAAHCAPPGNKPAPAELNACSGYLVRELTILQPRVTLCLGGIAWKAAMSAWIELGVTVPAPKPGFAHAREVEIGSTTLLGCYHVSQQNTFTGRLTEAMIDRVLTRAQALASL